LEIILVIDVGPTRCRVSYVGRQGGVVAAAEGSYLTGMVGNWVEQEPRDWWYEMTLALKELRQQHPEITPSAITLTGYPRILVLADDLDRLDSALLPSDRRSTGEWQEMVQQVGIDALLASADNVHDSTSHIARLMWLKKHSPTNYERARVIFLAAHEYIAWRLCGARVTDSTTASLTDLYSLRQNDWAFDLLDVFQLRKDWFPRIVSAGTHIGDLDAAIAEKLGLPAGLPIYHGTADLAATLLGTGVTKSHQTVCYLGDSGWLGAIELPEPGDPVTGLVNLRNPLGDGYMVIGPMITAGGNFEWLKDRFGVAEESLFADEKLPLVDLMMTLAAEAAVGSGGIIYLPYLSGEQAPFKDPNARGGWFNVSRRSWRSDLYRAVLEGVAYSLRAIQLILPEAETTADPVLYLVGDENCTPFWAQIFADVFDCRVELLSPLDEVTARGAAYAAGRTMGWHSTATPPYEFISSKGTYVPNPMNVPIYERMFNIFYKLYPALRSAFAEMSGSDNLL